MLRPVSGEPHAHTAPSCVSTCPPRATPIPRAD